MTFGIKFWGVRGNIAVSLPSHAEFGGNTSCIEVILGDRHIIFNAGTGIRELGREMMAREVREIDILFTHSSWDHIAGFPFFVPAYVPGHAVRIFSGHLGGEGGIRNILSSQMKNPTFPIPLETMQANLAFEDFEPGNSFELFAGASARTTALNHPIGATAYRLDFAGKSLAVVAPTEHDSGPFDEAIGELVKDCDLVIYDCTFAPEEYPDNIGSGHSTWQAGVAICRSAGAKQMAMYHHGPDHDDATIKQLERDAREVWPQVFAAKDSMELSLNDETAGTG